MPCRLAFRRTSVPRSPAGVGISFREAPITRDQRRPEDPRMGDDKAVEGVARPILAKRRDHHVLETVLRHPHVEGLLQDGQRGEGRGADPADLVEVLQFQHDRRRDDEVGAVDQRPRFVTEFFCLPPDEPDDDVGVEEDARSSDHSWDQSSSTRASGSPTM